MQLEPRVGRDLARPALVPEPRVVVGALPHSGEQGQRVGVAHRLGLAFRAGGGVVRQRIEAQLGQPLGIELHLAGLRLEAGGGEVPAGVREAGVSGFPHLLHGDAAVAQQELVELALGLPGDEPPGFGDPAGFQAPGQVAGDAKVAAGLALRRHRGLDQAQARPGCLQRYLLVLQPGSLGQHHVRVFRGGVHHVGGHREEVQGLEGGQGLRRVRIGDRNVDAAYVHGAHGVGLAGEHRFDDRGVVARGLPALGSGP